LLNAADLGLLASLGIAEVSVWRKLRVAFLSTGDELWNNCACHDTNTSIFFDFFIIVLTRINCGNNSKTCLLRKLPFVLLLIELSCKILLRLSMSLHTSILDIITTNIIINDNFLTCLSCKLLRNYK
jgi:hypothetical protein